MTEQEKTEKTTDPQDGNVLIVERRESVALITLNRPKVLNARNRAMRRALVEACQELDQDPTVRAIILTGSGHRAFSTGLDLAELAKDSAKQAPGMIVGQSNDIAQVASLRKPSIAAINGLAVGGGLELCLACDLRIAAQEARFGLLELRRGTIPGNGGTQRLPRLIGVAKALELLLTAELIPASQAKAFGLVNQVVPDEQLIEAAFELADTVAKQAPLALVAAKEAVWKGSDMDIESALALEQSMAAKMRKSEDFREGVTAFREKRDPIWKGV